MIQISWEPSLSIAQEHWFIDYYMDEKGQIDDFLVTFSNTKDLSSSNEVFLGRSEVEQLVTEFQSLKIVNFYPFKGDGGPDCDLLTLRVSNNATSIKLSWGAESSDWKEVRNLVEKTLRFLRQKK